MKRLRHKFQRYFVLALASTVAAFAQADPWSASATALKTAFTGPLATALIAVAIVVCGITFSFSESGGKRMLAGIAFGGSMAMGAVRFMSWLYP